MKLQLSARLCLCDRLGHRLRIPAFVSVSCWESGFTVQRLLHPCWTLHVEPLRTSVAVVPEYCALFSEVVLEQGLAEGKHYGWWCKSCITLRTLNYGNYGVFPIMGNAGFISSTVTDRYIRSFLSNVPHPRPVYRTVFSSSSVQALQWSGTSECWTITKMDPDLEFS